MLETFVNPSWVTQQTLFSSWVKLGEEAVEYSPDIYAFKPTTEDWVRLGELTKGRYLGHGIAISNNEILVIGDDVAEICKIEIDNAICEGNDSTNL